jgi:membrane associated rhomboid family serine protease
VLGSAADMATCYRHPGRETGVSCSNCGRPICPDCMTPTPVGMRCPECSRDRTPVKTLRTMYAEPTVTYALIAINVVAFLIELATGGRTSRVIVDFATLGIGIDRDGPVGVAQGELWRLITGGFLHAPTNPLHILFNMYLLFVLGRMLEPVLGHVRFAALYFAALLAGSFGAIVAAPGTLTLGASGAVFGLMGAAFAMERARGVDPRQSGVLPLIVINLLLGFAIPGVSVGGHIGGLIGGGIAALAMDRLSGRPRGAALSVAACFLVAVVSVAGAIAFSQAKADSLGLASALLPF